MIKDLKTLGVVQFFLRLQVLSKFKALGLALVVVCVLLAIGVAVKMSFEKKNLTTEKAQLLQDKEGLTAQIKSLESKIEALENEDQRKTNEELKKIIKETERTLRDYALLVEKIADARSLGIKTADLEKEGAEIVRMLSDLNYASASAKLSVVSGEVNKLLAQQQTAVVEKSAPSVQTSQDLPTSGHRRQIVSTERGSFMADIVAAQVGTTRVIVDTASENDCSDNCPVLPLATYVQRNGGFAGINGSYFCPAEYPSCAGKTNSYDTLAMNSRTKKYFNSENNKFSTVPLVAFDGGGAPRFMMQTVEWGRETSVQAVIANHPMLIHGGNIAVNEGSLSEKQKIKSSRSVVANKGNYIFLMVVHSASVPEAAVVMKALGIDNALSLDSGGSTALYFGGSYKIGPGRNLPNAIIFAL